MAEVNIVLVTLAICALENEHNKLPADDIKSEFTIPEQLVFM